MRLHPQQRGLHAYSSRKSKSKGILLGTRLCSRLPVREHLLQHQPDVTVLLTLRFEVIRLHVENTSLFAMDLDNTQ